MRTNRLGRMPLPPVITSRTNARVKALRAAFSGKASRPGELVGIEGFKSVLEAFKAGLRFETLAVTVAGSEEHTPERVALLSPREMVVLSEEVMASVADTVSPPQIVATVEIPEERRKGPPSRIFLLLETLQDPGNLGTLIRSAEAFGIERVVLSPGCANPWSPKVIRASAGSVFRQAMVRQPLAAAMEELQTHKVRLVGAVVRGEGASVSLAMDLAAPIGLVIGNEGTGLSEEALSLVNERVYIPCFTESLNAAVAGSVLLYDVLSRSVQKMAVEDDEAGRRAG